VGQRPEDDKHHRSHDKRNQDFHKDVGHSDAGEPGQPPTQEAGGGDVLQQAHALTGLSSRSLKTHNKGSKRAFRSLKQSPGVGPR